MVKNKITVVLTISTLLFFTYYLYAPGLTGGFLLDDLSSLSKLGLIGGELSGDSLWQYFAASETGPLKRPISVFSFLLDAQNWPAEPISFKQTNLYIHLFNGLILFTLIYKLFNAHKSHQKNAVFVAGLSSALWLLSPFLLSTTLYIVQRMSMLPTLFSLLGLLSYFVFRTRYSNKPSKFNAVLLLILSYMFVMFAVLSKENGILLVLLYLLFETMICQKWLGMQPLGKVFNLLLLKLPVILVSLTLIVMMYSSLSGYDFRVFDLTERLLSQFRAISKYLFHLFMPNYFTEGVFTDGFIKSTGLLNPISTLYSIIFVTGLLGLAWIYRNKYIWFSFAVFFFFMGHLLESTALPLELYFEHRNYLPALFLYVPLAIFLAFLIEKTKLYYVVALALVLVSAMSLKFRADLWANEHFLYQQTIDKFPESNRARIFYASLHEAKGMSYDALKVIEEAIERSDKLELRLDAVFIKCQIQILKEEDMSTLIEDFDHAPFTKDDVKIFESIIDQLLNNKCNNDELLKYYYPLVLALEQNLIPRAKYGVPLVYYFKAKYELFINNQPQQAAELYQDAFEFKNDYVTVVMGIKDLIETNELSYAFDLTEKALLQYTIDFKYKVDWKGYGKVLQAYKEIINQKIQGNNND